MVNLDAGPMMRKLFNQPLERNGSHVVAICQEMRQNHGLIRCQCSEKP